MISKFSWIIFFITGWRYVIGSFNINESKVGIIDHDLVNIYENDGNIIKGSFKQTLDHFDDNNENTTKWNQRFFVNTKFYRNNGPAFLFIGGESKAKENWMSNGLWINLAETFGAICFQLEHRFYGESRPTEDASVKNLRYLSSRQALGDIANFIQIMNKEYNLTENVKWIMFGGSYSGNLAAWARLKYPQQVFGAISSSAPVNSKVDFYEYYEVVEESLRTYNNKCPDMIRIGTNEMEKLVNDEENNGKQKLEDLFNICSPGLETKYDISNFFDAISTMFSGTVQYNMDQSSRNIKTICETMTNDNTDETPLERLAKLNKQYHHTDEDCLDITFNDTITLLSHTSWEEQISKRAWIYQTCNELGSFQTTKHNSVFGNRLDLDFHFEQCKRAFGIESDQIEERVKNTRIFYQGNKINVTHVMFLLGSIDPWHPLGVINSTIPDMPSYYIQGASHTADMLPINKYDWQDMKSAKGLVFYYMFKWLYLENN